MAQLLAVGCGGFLGAILRTVLTQWVQGRVEGAFPAGTLAVNVLGCFVLGLLTVLFENRLEVSEHTRLFLTAGLLGALTTFSAFGHEVFVLLRDGRTLLALGTVAANVLVGLGAVLAGRAVAG